MMTQRTLLYLFLATPILRADSCAPILSDPVFELWCDGETLCSWRVDNGTIQRVPTWHEADFGVELSSPNTQISQLIQRGNTGCLEITTLANVDDSATLELLIDFLDDGVMDHRQPIVGQNWARAQFLITPPPWFDDVAAPPWYQATRVFVRKTGDKRAVLAEMNVTATDGARCTAPAVELRGAPLGVPCANPAGCASGQCGPGTPRPSDTILNTVCGECTDDDACDAGEICGITTRSNYLPYASCVAAGRDPLGAACRTDAECAGGICCGGTCSVCCGEPGRGCPAGAVCKNGVENDGRFAILSPDIAWRCDAEQHKGRAGDACVVQADCMSGTCSSTIALKFCAMEGRDCVANESCNPVVGSPFGDCILQATPGLCR